jgi:UDP-N-acetylglucosamine 2-epimerase (non-hydrolysing)
MKKKILITVGTRPELLKVISLYFELKKNKSFNVYLYFSGQHRELISELSKMFQIKPDFLSRIKITNNSLNNLTSVITKNADRIIKKTKPDLVIVHGDTATTYSTALAAFYQNIPVAHLEAGLRTYDLHNPFPEELYRQVVSRIATYHFAPHIENKRILQNENVNSKKIFVTGNTIIDALKLINLKINKNKDYALSLNRKLSAILNFNYLRENYILITTHRRENLDGGIESILKALKSLSKKYKQFRFVLVVHPNPKVRKFIYSNLVNKKNIHIIQPLNYDLFISLVSKTKLILTDSGGIQEEAPSLGIPVLVLRKKTERKRSISYNYSKLIGSEFKNIIVNCEKLLKDKKLLKNKTRSQDIYGDGKASTKIVKILNYLLNK